MFDDEDESIGGRVLKEFQKPTPDWSKYSLEEIHRAYGGLIGWRKKHRTQKKKNQEDWTENGNQIRIIQTVLAGKWAQRGKAALLEKIATMAVNCSNPDRINNYDDLFLAELRAAYARLKSATEEK